MKYYIEVNGTVIVKNASERERIAAIVALRMAGFADARAWTML